jgi:hypothetical protein
MANTASIDLECKRAEFAIWMARYCYQGQVNPYNICRLPGLKAVIKPCELYAVQSGRRTLKTPAWLIIKAYLAKYHPPAVIIEGQKLFDAVLAAKVGPGPKKRPRITTRGQLSSELYLLLLEDEDGLRKGVERLAKELEIE